MTTKEMQDKLETLEKENAALKAAAASKISIQISKAGKDEAGNELPSKGGVSVYGLQRFPITHYAATWLKLIELGPSIAKFIEENKDKLSWK